MTIHPVRMSGTVIGVPQTYYYFERMQDRIIKFVTKHSGITEEKFREYLLATDQIATRYGIADRRDRGGLLRTDR